MPTSDKRVIIFAGSRIEALNYINKERIEMTKVVIVYSKEQTFGVCPDEFEAVRIGSWSENNSVRHASEYWEQKVASHAARRRPANG